MQQNCLISLSYSSVGDASRGIKLVSNTLSKQSCRRETRRPQNQCVIHTTIPFPLRMRNTLLYIIILLSALTLHAQTTKETIRTWAWGVGRGSVLDTYLSPLTYTGTNFTLFLQTERQARWGHGHVTVQAIYTGQGAYLHSPTDDGKDIDAELSAAGGWLYHWDVGTHWRLSLGGMIEGSGGFTYNTRNSNNPAQARLGTDLQASARAEYAFKFFGQKASARLQLDGQALGMQFSPEYGQSYYEIFSLGHSHGIIHLTHPGNCPSARMQATVTLPVKRTRLTLGWLSDVRQSKLGGLKRHAWRNTFIIGYTRQLRRL